MREDNVKIKKSGLSLFYVSFSFLFLFYFIFNLFSSFLFLELRVRIGHTNTRRRWKRINVKQYTQPMISLEEHTWQFRVG